MVSHSAGASVVPGEWLVDANGGIFSIGGAPFYGSASGQSLASPVVGMARPPVAAATGRTRPDGGIFAYGDAPFYGSMGGRPLNAPMVGMAATPDGKGYGEVASDGGIFAFGDANFYGSTGSLHLNVPIVGMESTSDGKGYWLVAGDGGIFNYGDAGFFGSTGSIRLNQPIVGMATTPGGGGYWMAARDGGIFSFGNAAFYGATPALDPGPVSAITATPDGKGYWEAATDGAVYPHGDAASFGANGMSLAQPVVGARAVGPELWLWPVLTPASEMESLAGYTSSQMTMDDTFSGGSVNSSNWNTEVDPGTVWDNADFGSGLLHRRQDQRGGVLLIRSGRRRQRPHPDVRETNSSDIGYSKGFDWVSAPSRPRTRCPPPAGTSRSAPRCPTAPTACGPPCGSCRPARPRSSTASRVAGRARAPTSRATATCSPLGPAARRGSTGGAALNAGYNTYGFQYIPGQSVTAYLNGKQVYQASGSVASEAYYLIIELQVASSSTSGWHTSLSSSTPNPSTMNIAEVQIYS